MASKLVTDRQKAAEVVAATGTAQGALLERELSSALRASSGAKLDVGAIVAALNDTLLAARDKMVQADEAHEQELGDDAPVRDARDHAVEALSERVIELREILVGLYGQDFAAEIASGGTPRDPVVLARFAGEIANNIGAAKFPESRLEGVGLDAASTAAGLTAARKALGERLEGVAVEVKESQATLGAKNEAIEHYDRVFTGVANILTGLFILAGKDELASKVRPSSRRPGRTDAEAARKAPPAQ